ncbi:MAG: adenosylcobinamide-phosphate synthase CbiB [Eubacteriaceae bacterium]|nr:adenosylcobinamide-phosphate synthase CbiB [Eubacteriaceae bacterium]
MSERRLCAFAFTMKIAVCLLIGFALDFFLHEKTLFTHPIVLIGKQISWMERLLRKTFVRKPSDEWAAGALLAFVVAATAGGVAYLAVRAFSCFGLAGEIMVGSYFAFRTMAAKSLYNESVKVYYKLAEGDLVGARVALSWIVGRDTERLSEEEVAKGCIETIAENTADGIGAPLFWFALFGPVGSAVYKAINTMDSMVGYKNDRYIRFGFAAAKLDDMASYLPSRITALVMILASYALKMDFRNAWRIYLRDRRKHASPNSAQTESVAAGALGLMLGGNANYFGMLHEKPSIGDKIKAPGMDEILQAEKLMYMTSLLCCLIFAAAAAVLSFA